MSKLPTITSKIPPDLRQFLERVRESINAGVGGQLSADELRNLIRNSGGGAGSGGLGGGVLTGPGTGILYPTPPAPTGLDALGAMASIIVTWDQPSYQGHAYTEIWASSSSDFSTAVMVGMAPGSIFTHTIGGAATRYYWIRFVNANMQYTPGPFNSLTGFSAATAIDPGYVLDLIANATDLNPFTIAADAFKITSASGDIMPFAVISVPTTINGFLVPVGVYMDGAYMKTGTISRAAIGLAAIDDARIAELSADKVTFGTMHGDRIQVGSMNADRINVSYLSAIAANMGTCTSGTFKTDEGTGWRTEISSAGSWPIWYGLGTKTAGNGRFTLDHDGNITIRNGIGEPMFSVIENTLILSGDDGNIILSSATGVPWNKIASGGGKPADGATKNVLFSQAAEPATPVDGDIWYVDGDTPGRVKGALYLRSGGGWIRTADATFNMLGGSGVNIANPRYATFEEIDSPPISGISNGTIIFDGSRAYFGSRSLKLVSSSNDCYAYLSSDYISDFNITLQSNKKWIISAYVFSEAVIPVSGVDLFIKTSAGNHYSCSSLMEIPANTWSRVYGVLNLSADSANKAVMRVDNNYSGATIWFDGLMLEAQIGEQTTPSAYHEPPNFLTTFVGELDANKSFVYRQSGMPTGGVYSINDLWFDTDSSPPELYQWDGDSWALVSNAISGTSQLLDDAGLGLSADWLTVTSRPTSLAELSTVDAATLAANAAKLKTSQNLLYNGGFENGFSGWTGDTALCSLVDGIWGRSVVAYNVSGTGTLTQSGYAAIQAGEYYTLTGDSLLLGGVTGGSVYFDILWYGSTHSFLGESGQNQISTAHDFSTSDDTRNTHAIEVQAPASTFYCKVRFVWQSIAGSDVIVGCRQIKLERGRLPATPYSADATLPVLQAEANAAQQTADSAVAELTSIASDSILSKGEKPSVIRDFSAITSEKDGIITEASNLGLDYNAYNSSISTLQTYLNSLSPAWNNTAFDTAIVAATFKQKFVDVYVAKQALLNAIVDKASTLANWSSVANRPLSLADLNAGDGSALSDAAANALTAVNAVEAIVADNILSTVEKSALKKEWDAILSEKSTLEEQANAYGIVTEKNNYTNAFKDLADYLNNQSTWTSGTPNWINSTNIYLNTTLPGGTPGASFRAVFVAYYTARVLLIKKVTDTAKANINTAATTSIWTGVTGSGKPEDNATVGANETNWSVNASATVNALVMTPQVIKFFDENGVCRGKFGKLN